jgi:quercetin dioxygenase-like cupin family protein
VHSRPSIARSGEGERYRWPGFDIEIVVPGAATGGGFGIIEFTIAPRRLVPPHIHVAEDELSYVLGGEVGFRVGDDVVTATAGSYVRKPRGIQHTFWNATDRRGSSSS